MSQTIDNLLGEQPTQRLAVVVLMIMTIAIFIGYLLYSAGEARGISQVGDQKTAKEIRLEKENELSAMREKGLRDDAQKLLAQNEILKAQNEAQAEILTANGKRIDSVKVEKLNQLSEKLNEKYDQISSSVDDPDVQRHHLCAEARSAGYRLSDDFCRN